MPSNLDKRENRCRHTETVLQRRVDSEASEVQVEGDTLLRHADCAEDEEEMLRGPRETE